MSRRSTVRSSIASAVTVVLAWSLPLGAPLTYPDTLWVPVTFYDFHANGSCPDFQPMTFDPSLFYVRTGLAGPLLDADSLPVMGDSVLFSRDLRYWFRPWADSARSDPQIPVYGTNGSFTGWSHAPSDTAYKDVVIRDSLPFQHVGSGLYEYHNPNFFPLDGRGFGAEPAKYPAFSWTNMANHNYSFTMHMRRRIVYTKGLRFRWRSDDDLWVFVNGTLVVDLGGMHPPVSATLGFDTIAAAAGIPVGGLLTVDVFYAERMLMGADILLSTSIVSCCPCLPPQVGLHPGPDTICPADSAVITATIRSDTGAVLGLPPSSVTWGFVDGDVGKGVLTSGMGTQVIFHPAAGGVKVGVWCEHVDSFPGCPAGTPAQADTSRDTAFVVVLAACHSGSAPAYGRALLESAGETDLRLFTLQGRAASGLGANRSGPGSRLNGGMLRGAYIVGVRSAAGVRARRLVAVAR